MFTSEFYSQTVEVYGESTMGRQHVQLHKNAKLPSADQIQKLLQNFNCEVHNHRHIQPRFVTHDYFLFPQLKHLILTTFFSDNVVQTAVENGVYNFITIQFIII